MYVLELICKDGRLHPVARANSKEALSRWIEEKKIPADRIGHEINYIGSRADYMEAAANHAGEDYDLMMMFISLV